MARIFKFNIGDLDAFVLEEDYFETSLDDIFLQSSQSVLAKVFNKFNPKENCETGFNYLGLKVQGKLVLIDTGRGTGALIKGLYKLGYSPESVDYIMITHGDSDHVGGLSDFKYAKIVMPQKAFDLWSNHNSYNQLLSEFESAPFMGNVPTNKMAMALLARKKYVDFLQNLPKDKLILIKEHEWFLNNLKFIYAPGHRSDHFAIEISTENQSLIHYSDAVRHPLQMVNPFVHSKYDSYPSLFSETLQDLCAYSKLKNAVQFCTHYKFPGFLN